MTVLRLNGRRPDTEFQKSLNTFAKRHHIRLWHEPQSNIWLGTATEDVNYRIQHMHLTHAANRYIDSERAKVVNDLAFTGCVDEGILIPRPSLRPAEEPANSIVTDGDLAVLHVNECTNPHAIPANQRKPRPVRAVRVAIALGEDVLRSNPISVGYALVRSLLEVSKERADRRSQQNQPPIRRTFLAKAGSSGTEYSRTVR
jgi:hypothetical protein